MNFEDYENYYDFIKDENRNFSNFIDIDANVENKYIDSLINIHREVQSVILNDRKDITNKLKLLFNNKYSNFNANKKILKSEEVELLSNFGNRNYHYDYNFVFTDRYFDKIRVRKQKNKRIFIKSCQLFYKAKDEFGFYEVRRLILLDCFSLNLLELSDMIKKRSDFISCLRKCKDIPKNSYYMCFLSFNVKLGFYLNFFIIYNEKNKLKEDLYSKIIRIWIDVLNSDFNQIGSHSLYRDYEVFFMNFKDIGINRLSESSENKISNKLDYELLSILKYLSYKNMLYSYNNYKKENKTFVSGHLRPTQKRKTKNNQLYLEGNMLQYDNINNSLRILIGYNIRHGSECIYWYPNDSNNAFLLIVGQSGSGKTNMLRNICNQLIDKNIPVWVFDPHGSMSDLKLENVFLSSGTDSTIGVNPLRIYASNFKQKGVFDYIRSIQSMIKYSIPNMGSNQSAILKKALDKVYEVYTHPSSVLPREIDAPNLKNVLDELNLVLDSSTKKNQDSIQTLLNVIEDVFIHPVFSRKPDINILDIIEKNIYFDISKLDAKERFIIFETILRQMFDIFSESESLKYNQLRLVIMIDETRLLNIAGGKEAYHRMLNVIANEGRKFGISLILASQSSEHFSNDIITNAASKILFKLSNKDISLFSGGNSQISEDLKNLATGCGLFIRKDYQTVFRKSYRRV